SVSAPDRDNEGKGFVIVFKKDLYNGSWRNVHETIYDTDPSGVNEFGSHISVSAGMVAIASNVDTDDKALSGIAYDIDNDGVDNEADPSPYDDTICADTDGDGCDDCYLGYYSPLDDNCNGTESDSDGDQIVNTI